MLKKVIKEEENKENLLQDRLNQAQKTITKLEENLMNLRLKEEDKKVILQLFTTLTSQNLNACSSKLSISVCLPTFNSGFQSYLWNN